MGQKVNPHSLRVGVIKDWDSRWFAGKRDFGKMPIPEPEKPKKSRRRTSLQQVANLQ